MRVRCVPLGRPPPASHGATGKRCERAGLRPRSQRRRRSLQRAGAAGSSRAHRPDHRASCPCRLARRAGRRDRARVGRVQTEQRWCHRSGWERGAWSGLGRRRALGCRRRSRRAGPVPVWRTIDCGQVPGPGSGRGPPTQRRRRRLRARRGRVHLARRGAAGGIPLAPREADSDSSGDADRTGHGGKGRGELFAVALANVEEEALHAVDVVVEGDLDVVREVVGVDEEVLERHDSLVICRSTRRDRLGSTGDVRIPAGIDGGLTVEAFLRKLRVLATKSAPRPSVAVVGSAAGS